MPLKIIMINVKGNKHRGNERNINNTKKLSEKFSSDEG